MDASPVIQESDIPDLVLELIIGFVAEMTPMDKWGDICAVSKRWNRTAKPVLRAAFENSEPGDGTTTIGAPTTREGFVEELGKAFLWAKRFEFSKGWLKIDSTATDGLATFERPDATFVRSELDFPFPAEDILGILETKSLEVRRQFAPDLERFEEITDPALPTHTGTISNTGIFHIVVKLPWPLSPRDFIGLCAHRGDGHGRFVQVMTPIKHQAVPEDSTHVRGLIKLAHILVQRNTPSGVVTHVTRLATVDPRGMIPAFVVAKKKKEDGQRLINIRAILIKKMKK